MLLLLSSVEGICTLDSLICISIPFHVFWAQFMDLNLEGGNCFV